MKAVGGSLRREMCGGKVTIGLYENLSVVQRASVDFQKLIM